MQGRITRIDKNLLHRTAGPYIGSVPDARSAARASLFLFRCRELLQSEGVALVGQRLMAGQAFRLVDALLILLGRGENRIIPVFIAEELGDVVSPTRFALHRRVSQQFVGNVKAIGARNRVAVCVQLRREHLSEQDRAIGNGFPAFAAVRAAVFA